MAEQKRRGRPPKTPKPGKRVSLGLKVTSDVKQRIDSAARASGRTQSQEAEALIELALQRGRLLNEALELAFGKALGGILLLIGEAMKEAGRSAAFFEVKTLEATENWFDNAYAYEQATQAAQRALEALRPPGNPTPAWRLDKPAAFSHVNGETGFSTKRPEDVPETAAHLKELPAALGAGFANGLLAALQGRGATADDKSWAEPVTAMLGPLVDRIK